MNPPNGVAAVDRLARPGRSSARDRRTSPRAALAGRLVVVDLDADEPTVNSPYRARLIIKSLRPRSRRWDPQRLCWVVDRDVIRVLIGSLRTAGFEVDVWSGGRMRTLAATGTRRRP